MTTIFYGGTREQVEKQLDCIHDWHGPCIDEISRYYKCMMCFCMERDCTENEHKEMSDNEQNGRIKKIEKLLTSQEWLCSLAPYQSRRVHSIVRKSNAIFRGLALHDYPDHDLAFWYLQQE